MYVFPEFISRITSPLKFMDYVVFLINCVAHVTWIKVSCNTSNQEVYI